MASGLRWMRPGVTAGAGRPPPLARLILSPLNLFPHRYR